MARCGGVFHGLLVETRPADHAAQEQVLFVARPHYIHHGTVQQAEIGGTRMDVHVGEAPQQGVEKPGGDALEQGCAPIVATDRVHHIVARAPLGDQGGDELGRVLQVAIKADHTIALCMVQSGLERLLMPEVP
jgi:hypothetical protein